MSRILIVEDEESFSDPLSYLLEKEGFAVAVAATGPDALAEFDANGADLVLLDLMLPGLSGVEVCRALRAKSSVPIIMLTAKDSEIDKVVGLEMGADDYVTKPYSARELLARVRAVLRRLAAAHRSGLGQRLRRRHQDPRRAREAAARQDRARPGQPAAHPHRARIGLQVRGLSQPYGRLTQDLLAQALGLSSS